jgi:hypothetical protein
MVPDVKVVWNGDRDAATYQLEKEMSSAVTFI